MVEKCPGRPGYSKAAWPVVGGARATYQIRMPNLNGPAQIQPTNLALGITRLGCRVLAAVGESLERIVDPPDRRAIHDWRPTDTHEIRDITHEADWKQ